MPPCLLRRVASPASPRNQAAHLPALGRHLAIVACLSAWQIGCNFDDDTDQTARQGQVSSVGGALDDVGVAIDDDGSNDGECAPYNHPFTGVSRQDGAIPFLDTLDAPDGGRYAVVESAAQPADGGPMETFQGIVSLPSREISDDEVAYIAAFKAATNQASDDGSATGATAPTIGSELESAVDSSIEAGDVNTLRVHVALHRPAVPLFEDRLSRAVAEGRVSTECDLEPVAAEIQTEVQAEVAAVIDPVAAKLQELGISVLAKCKNGYCLTAEMLATDVAGAASMPEIQRMDIEMHGAEAIDTDQILINETYQLTQFWDSFYDGRNLGGGTALRFAIIEWGGYRTTHESFKGPFGSNRIGGMYLCNIVFCSPVSGWASPTFHATGTLSAVFSDLTHGQGSGYTANQRIARSGTARASWAYLYQTSSSTSTTINAFDHIAIRSPKPRVLTFSVPLESSQTCSGETTLDVAVDNLLYEQGIFPVFAAGNSGQSSSECTVWAPGAAAGAFTVGGYAGASSYSTYCVARAAALNSNSSSGSPTYAKGKLRSIIDILGSYRIRLRASNSSDSGYFATFDGTSIAAPSIAGSALAFIDMYRNARSTSIDYSPGRVAAWMTLMGDRYSQAGTRVWGFDKNTGAGRLRQRMITSEGMDAPWFWYGGSTCVSHNQVVTININGGNPLPSAAKDFKAVIWWYDRNLETGGIDNLDLWLRRTNDTFLRTSVNDWDNKEMVYYKGVGGQAVKLEIAGTNVSASNAGCGSNSMRVYYAAVIEDDLRNDTIGPFWDSLTCEGVQQL